MNPPWKKHCTICRCSETLLACHGIAPPRRAHHPALRHLLETHTHAEQILQTVTDLLVSKKLLLRTGTILNATLIAAPSSTKNGIKSRDPEMHQTKNDDQWYCGIKAHIGVDADSGLVHTVRATTANVNDVVQANSLLHGQETDGYGDARN